jgi:phage-related protein
MCDEFVYILGGNALEVCCTNYMKDFIMNLDNTISGKLITRISKLANYGFISNSKQFDKVRGTKCKHLYNIKLLDDQLRFFCYYNIKEKDKVVIFDVIEKKENNLPPGTYEVYCKRMKKIGLE